VGDGCNRERGNEPFIEAGVQAQTNASRAWKRNLRETFSQGTSGVDEPFKVSPTAVGERFRLRCGTRERVRLKVLAAMVWFS
jgi:hypothetical protein